MAQFTTRQTANKLGISLISLSRYISAKKVPAPKVQKFGGKFRAWTEKDIDRVRKLLPKIANGRKTRYQKKKSGVRSRKSVKPKVKKQPQANRPVLHKQRKKKH